MSEIKNNIFSINIRTLINLGEIRISETIFDIEDLKFLDDKDVFRINLDLKCNYVPDNFIFLNGSLKFFSKKICGRCLDEFDCILNPNVSEEVSFSSLDNYVNIESVINEAYWLNIPSVYICSSNCKGLCSLCGTNLNKEQCLCDRNKKEYFFKDIFSKINKN